MVITIIYFYRREQSKRITEEMDKAKIANIDVFYSYLVTFTFVALVVLSTIYANN
jgi:NADH:ubiquinone oxidoreductase subunit 6 (subunit J)